MEMAENGSHGRAKRGNKMVPAYKAWPSRNRFYCCGRIMTGPPEDDNLRLVTWLLMLVPMGLFMWSAGPDLLFEVRWLFITLCALFGLSVLFLLLTSYSDPGIVPRADGPAKPENGQHIRRVMVNGVQVSEMWCTTCLIYRPPGCTHCKDCDNCVLDWDHHCPFVGNCIGRRNYGYFTAFLACISLTAGFMVAACFVVTTGEEWLEHFSPSRVATMAVSAVLLFALLIALVLGCFTCFHVTLICSNLTTKEWCRSKQKAVTRESGCYRILCACCEWSRIEPHKQVPNPQVQSAVGYTELL